MSASLTRHGMTLNALPGWVVLRRHEAREQPGRLWAARAAAR
jgi:hypothetical protein